MRSEIGDNTRPPPPLAVAHGEERERVGREREREITQGEREREEAQRGEREERGAAEKERSSTARAFLSPGISAELCYGISDKRQRR